VLSWRKIIDILPECQLRTELFEHARALITREFTKAFQEAFDKAFGEAFGEDMANQEQEPEPEPEQEPLSEEPLSRSFKPSGHKNKTDANRVNSARVDSLADFFSEAFKNSIGAQPLCSSKEKAIFEELLASYSADQLKDLINEFFDSNDSFIKES